LIEWVRTFAKVIHKYISKESLKKQSLNLKTEISNCVSIYFAKVLTLQKYFNILSLNNSKHGKILSLLKMINQLTKKRLHLKKD